MHGAATNQGEDGRAKSSAAYSLFIPDGSRILWPRTGLVTVDAALVRNFRVRGFDLGELELYFVRVNIDVAALSCPDVLT